MMPRNAGLLLVADVFESVILVARLSWRRNVTAWLVVPVGLAAILVACFGVDSLIKSSGVSFPASVAILILLFFALTVTDLAIGDRRTRAVVSFIEVPAGFALRYINIFFTPSFVLLPLSPSIGGIEVGKIVAVFVIGFFVMLVVTAYMVRGLQQGLGSSKRAVVERAEEMGHEDDGIPLAASSVTARDLDSATTTVSINVIEPQPAHGSSVFRGSTGSNEDHLPSMMTPGIRTILQTPLPLTRPQRWARFMNFNFDGIIYASLFLFCGCPTYYIAGYALPAHLTLTVIAYFAASALPPRWKQFLHPVLVSSAITAVGIWILALTKGNSLEDALLEYKTGFNYLKLWHHEKHHKIPGAGDVFASILDASIVALALPMFQYRKELRSHFFIIVIPNLIVSIASLFGYPILCYAIGISPKRSLAFAARSLTLALAIPAVSNLGGDVNTVAALAIMSGIVGVLVGPALLKRLKIPEDDYVTRGVTLGANSSAIATALLLVSDPRAAALSSLSMSLFGIMTLTLTSIPHIVQVIDKLVEL